MFSRCCIVFLSLISFVCGQQLLVNTTLGPVQGFLHAAPQSGINVRYWTNIYYAASPAGANRWRKPQPRQPWTTPLVSVENSYIACYQYDAVAPTVTVTEDCLVVNVASPVGVTTNLPVMVWIHGGSLTNGYGSLFDGTALVAEQNVVFVSLNYRLNVFGFLGGSGFAAEADATVSNWGFLDQHAALVWVQNNIANFGGDPTQVTIFGESAGAISVVNHLSSPLSLAASPRLFVRAISESQYDNIGYWSTAEVEYFTAQLAHETPCLSVAFNPQLLPNCLRNVSVQALLATGVSTHAQPYRFTIDNQVIAYPYTAINSGNWARVPVFLGTNHDEYSTFLCPSFASTFQTVGLANLLLAIGTNVANATLVQNAFTVGLPPVYPPVAPFYSPFPAFKAAVDFVSDYAFFIPNRLLADALFFDAGNPFQNQTFMYQISYSAGYSNPCLLAGHGTGDVPLLFPGTYIPFPPYTYPAGEIALSKNIRAAWANFAKTSNPSIPSQTFSPYCQPGDTAITCKRTYTNVVGLPSNTSSGMTVMTGFRNAQYPFWAANLQYVDPDLPLPNAHLIRITGFPSSGCAASPFMFASVPNGTCFPVSIYTSATSTITVFVNAQCSFDDYLSPWSASFYLDSRCTYAIPNSVPLSGQAAQYCGATPLPASFPIPYLSAFVDCQNNAQPLVGTVTSYDATAAPSCGASSTGTVTAVQTAAPAGACLPLPLGISGTVRCAGATSSSAYTFLLYTANGNCAGVPSFTFQGSNSASCIPFINAKFDCGSGGAVNNPTVLPTPTPSKPSVAPNLLVVTTLGPVGGYFAPAAQNPGATVRTWTNIPYAASTAGAFRWRKPQARTAWTSPLLSVPGLIVGCPQQPYAGVTTSEDCLVLNVIAPANAPTTPLPVMVYIHGGGLISGAGGKFDGSAFVVEQNVIFVSINYRLGFLGFMGLNAFQTETDGNFANWGFLDQVFALQWIQANIAAFGGDPARVTIWGQSAGAISVANHLTSPLHLGGNSLTYAQAIIQSYYVPQAYWTTSESNYYGLQVALGTSCGSLVLNTPQALPACLRALPASTIVGSGILSTLFSMGLTIDGVVIAGEASAQIALGKWARVPLFEGSNHDEYGLFVCGSVGAAFATLTVQQLAYSLSSTISNSTLISLAYATLYQPPKYAAPGSAFRATIDLVSDYGFACPARSNLDAAALDPQNPNAQKTYMYQFNVFGAWSNLCLLAAHEEEIPLLFPGTYLLGPYNYTAADITLSKQLRAVWGAFATTGNPSTPAVTVPSYCKPGDTAVTCARSYFEINSTGLIPTANFKTTPCGFWAAEAASAAAALDVPGFNTKFVRVTSFPVAQCSAQFNAFGSLRNNTCSLFNFAISATASIPLYVIPQCASESAYSQWSANVYYGDPTCSSTPLGSFNGANSQTCSSTALNAPGTPLNRLPVSLIVSCNNNLPIFGTLAHYSSAAPSCNAAVAPSTPSPLIPSYNAVPSGACIPVSATASFMVQCWSSSAYTFRLFSASASCTGATQVVFNGQSAKDCIPIFNGQFDCSTNGGVPALPSVIPTLPAPSSLPPYVAGSPSATTSIQFTFTAMSSLNITLIQQILFPLIVNTLSLKSAGSLSITVNGNVATLSIAATIQNDGPVTAFSAKTILLYSASVATSQFSLALSSQQVTVQDPNPPPASNSANASTSSSNYLIIPIVVISVLLLAIIASAIIYCTCFSKQDKDTY